MAMVSTIRGTPVAMIIPPSQNTAPVLEFRCLYTHDVRRKQKRWQDGRLSFHTFNRRIMVRDSLQNFVGDTHWQDDSPLADGDDVVLEVGVLVQVCELIRTTETDLTSLLEKKTKTKTKMKIKTTNLSPARNHSQVSNKGYLGDAHAGPAGSSTSQIKHKSLHALLGGKDRAHPIGKAIPQQSPFEARINKSLNPPRNEPAAKRRRIGEPEPKTWSVTATSVRTPARPLSISKATNFNSNPNPSKTTSKASKDSLQGQTRLKVKQVIVLNSDTESSSQHVPPLPLPLPPHPKPNSPIAPKTRTSAAKNKRRPKSSPTPEPLIPSSPPVNSVSKIRNVEQTLQSRGKLRLTVDSPSTPSADDSTPRNPRAKALKLSKSQPRPTLLCLQNLDHRRNNSEFLSNDASSIGSSTNRQAHSESRPRNLRSKWKAAKQKDQLDHIDEADVDNIFDSQSAPRRPSSPSPELPTTNLALHRSTSRIRAQLSSSPTFADIPTNLLTGTPVAASPEGTLFPSRHTTTTAQRIPPIATNPVPQPPHQQRNEQPVPPDRPLRRVHSVNTAANTIAAALPPRTAQLVNAQSRTLLRRAQSANVDPKARADAKTSLLFSKPHRSSPKQPRATEQQNRDVGPWSSEAFDFLDWRPPDWEERRSRMPASVAMVD